MTRWRDLALERVASGLRINRAADDAAGSGVATNLRTTEGSRVAALQNTRTAMEMVRVAESGLQEIEEHLQRMRELAMAAASETLADDERAYLDDEMVERLDGIDDIAASTSFSGRGLLEGAGVDVAFLVDSSLSMVFEIGALQAAVSAFETYFSDANLDVRFSLTEINAGRDPLDGSRQLADIGDERFQSALSGLTTTFGLQDPYTALMEVAGLASVTGTQDPDAVSFRVGSLERHLIVLSDDPRELDLLPGAETAASVGQALADAGFIVHAINAPAVDSTFSPIVAATGGSQYDAGNFGQFIDAALDDIAAVITDRVGESEPIEVQVGLGSGASSRITLGLPINATSSGLGFSNLDISTLDGARAALDSIDRALDRLNQGRSVLGASSRRLDAVEHLHADLGQALGAAESTIRDADLAEAISELTQAEIVADAAMAARSQARRLSLDAVKSLLG